MLPIDHIGIAVPELANAVADYQTNFGAVLEYRERLPEQGVEVAFLKTGASRIELLAAIDKSSPFARSVASRGYGLHHICFLVKDIEKELARLMALGLRLVDAAPRLGAKGKRIAFIHPQSVGGVLTELCER